MSLGTKVFLSIAGAVALLMLLTVGVVAAAIYQAGTIDVDVRPADGGRVSVAVPAALANLAVALIPSSVLRDTSHELHSVLPAVRDAGRELWDAPDFVLLEVTGPDESFKIEKRDGQLIVQIDDDGNSVLIEIPIETLRKVTEKLGG